MEQNERNLQTEKKSFLIKRMEASNSKIESTIEMDFTKFEKKAYSLGTSGMPDYFYNLLDCAVDTVIKIGKLDEIIFGYIIGTVQANSNNTDATYACIIKDPIDEQDEKAMELVNGLGESMAVFYTPKVQKVDTKEPVSKEVEWEEENPTINSAINTSVDGLKDLVKAEINTEDINAFAQEITQGKENGYVLNPDNKEGQQEVTKDIPTDFKAEQVIDVPTEEAVKEDVPADLKDTAIVPKAEVETEQEQKQIIVITDREFNTTEVAETKAESAAIPEEPAEPESPVVSERIPYDERPIDPKTRLVEFYYEDEVMDPTKFEDFRPINSKVSYKKDLAHSAYYYKQDPDSDKLVLFK